MKAAAANFRRGIAVAALWFLPCAVHALLPLIPIGFGIAVTGTTTSSLILPITASTIVVGGTIAALSFGGTPGQTNSQAPIVAHLNPLDPLPTPAGWTAPVSPAVQPSPPGTDSTVPGWHSGFAACSSQREPTPFAAATLCLATPGITGQTGVAVTGCMAQDATTQQCTYTGSLGGGTIGVTNTFSCSTGYAFSGGNCVLNNAAIVPKPSDGQCTVIRDGNSFAGDPRDPDCAAPNIPGTVTLSAPSVVVRPSAVQTDTVTINGDGTTTITSVVGNPNNTTTTTTITTSGAPGVPGGVTITGKGVATVNGTGTQVAGGTLPDFPTDYNREVTQAAINAKLGQIKEGQCGGAGQVKCDVKIDETGTPLDSALQVQKDALDAAAAAREAAIIAVGSSPRSSLGLSLDINWPNATCVDPSVVIRGYTLTVGLCSGTENVRLVFGWILAVLTAFSIFSIGINGMRGS